MAMTYKEFYNKMGISEFPFNTYTTEQEIDFASKVFVSQSEYDHIIDTFKSSRNLIILGERGSGKTAILEDFKRISIKNKNVYTQIVDFSALSNPSNPTEIYRLIISNLLVELFAAISRRKYKLLFLNKEDKILLSYLLSEFLPHFSKNLLKDKISDIQAPFWIRVPNWIYNKIRGPLNFTGTVGKNILYQYFLKHYSFLPVIENDNQIHQFFPELKLNVDYDFFNQDISFSLLKKVATIAKKITGKKPSVLFDRMDEDNRFDNDAETISAFVKPFLSDNNLLSAIEIQMIFFVWRTPFRFIEDDIRTQKYYCPSLKWSKNDLEKMINKRLEYYSDKKISNYSSLFETNVSSNSIDNIFLLANSNPRDLIHVFKKIFEEQFNINNTSQKLTNQAIDDALIKYVRDFNYYEYYPKKSNARANSMDIYSYSAHLLKLDIDEFTKDKLNQMAGTGSSTNNYVVNMERIGLVENVRQDKGVAIYKIKDPKISFALRNKLEINKSGR